MFVILLLIWFAEHRSKSSSSGTQKTCWIDLCGIPAMCLLFTVEMDGNLCFTCCRIECIYSVFLFSICYMNTCLYKYVCIFCLLCMLRWNLQWTRSPMRDFVNSSALPVWYILHLNQNSWLWPIHDILASIPMDMKEWCSGVLVKTC